MNDHDSRQLAPSTAVTAAGVDHVRLSYHYLDAGDLDAYGSLLAEDALLERPDAPHARGRTEVLRAHAAAAGRAVRHRITQIIADGDSVAAQGLLSRTDDTPEVGFVDCFTLSADGLLLRCRRYYFATPR